VLASVTLEEKLELLRRLRGGKFEATALAIVEPAPAR
jgi:hypothetical protein